MVVCWLTTNRRGSLLYASNTADSTITVYEIASDPRAQRELQKLSLRSHGGTYQLALSPDERNLVVVSQRFESKIPLGVGWQ